jgi:hypothetical protein
MSFAQLSTDVADSGRSIWDREGEDPPGPEAHPRDQAGYVADLVLGLYFPDIPRLVTYRRVAVSEGYSWPSVRVELSKLGVFQLPPWSRSDNSQPLATDVGITLSNRRQKDRVIKTLIDHWIGTHQFLDHDAVVEGDDPNVCTSGIGVWQRHTQDRELGRDAQTRCKKRPCPACGPLDRDHKVEKMAENAAAYPLHGKLFGPEEEPELKAIIRKLNRKGANYYRIPTPDEMTCLVTTYVGEAVDIEDLEALVELQPLDGRRLSSSRPWKFTDPPIATGEWEMIGKTYMGREDRKRIYEEEGIELQPIPHSDHFVTSDTFRRPPEATDVDRLERRIDIFTPDVKRDRWGRPI